MPFALLIVGAMLLISAVKGTQGDLYSLISKDFQGPQNYIYWMVAILVIGALGYVPKLKPISVAMLGLVVLVLFLSRGDPSKAGGGFFEKFTAGLATTTAASSAAAGTAASPATSTAAGPLTMPSLPSISSLVH